MDHVVYIAGSRWGERSFRRARDVARLAGASLTVVAPAQARPERLEGACLRTLPGARWPEALWEGIPTDAGLVVKVASPPGEGRERRRVDVELLRRLPCTIWLRSSLRFEESRGPVVAAVALDDDSAALDRAVLQVADLVAAAEQVSVCVVHAWAVLGESIVTCPVRGMGPTRARRFLRWIRKEHETRLERLLSEAGGAAPRRILMVKGSAPVGIGAALRRTEPTALIMGYRGREGVWGWIQPNLAEAFLGIPGLSLVAVREGVS